MQRDDKINHLFQTFLAITFAIIGFLLIRSINSIDSSVESATKSVNELNRQVGNIITEVSYQRRDIDAHSQEIKEIKQRIYFKK